MAILSGIILLLPSILSLAFPGENPSVVRTAGAIPVVAVLVGLGLYVVTRAAKELGGTRWGVWLAVPLLALILTATTRHQLPALFCGLLSFVPIVVAE